MNLASAETVLRLVNREVWIITAADGSQRGGLAASWVQPASVDSQRPVLLAGIAPNHFTAELIDASGAFAAHLLRSDQIDLAWNFASDSGRNRDKLADLTVTNGKTGSPILTDCLAWCDCRVFARLDAGDRLFYWADLVGASAPSPTIPLPPSERGDRNKPLREHEFIQCLNGDQRAALLAAREADVMIQRPKHEAWRKTQSSLSLGRPAKHNQP